MKTKRVKTKIRKKMFCCTYCPLEFSDKSNMNRHIKVSCPKNPHSLKKIQEKRKKHDVKGVVLKNPEVPKDPEAEDQEDMEKASKAAISKTEEFLIDKFNNLITQKQNEIQQQMTNKLQEQKEELEKKYTAEIEQLKKEQEIIKGSPITNNSNTININNNIIYVTDKLDYLEILNKKLGGETENY